MAHPPPLANMYRERQQDLGNPLGLGSLTSFRFSVSGLALGEFRCCSAKCGIEAGELVNLSRFDERQVSENPTV